MRHQSAARPMTAYNNLVEFWRKYKTDSPQGFHSEDNIPSKRTVHITCISDYARSELFFNDGTVIHTGLLPGPYCGDILKARVYFLQLNPGFGPCDLYCENVPEIRDAAEKNLYQRKTKYPFTPLNPEFCWTGGAGWWHKKLKPLFELYRKKGISYLDACKDMSGKIAALELFTYQSAGFSRKGSVLKIKSVELITAFAGILSQDKSKLFLVMRQPKEWGLRKGKNVRIFSSEKRQSASLSDYADDIFRYLEKP
jgi:hypothetical protein